MSYLKKITLLIFCSLLFSCSGIFAYTLDSAGNSEAMRFVQLINKKLSTLPIQRAQAFKMLIQSKLVQAQNALIKTQETIFDDGVGAIWTHASNGFGILYNPMEPPSIGTLASGTSNTLINGSYFARTEGAKNHAGLLWNGGVMWSEMAYSDPQITHVVCVDTQKYLTFWKNDLFFDEILQICELAFQAGPLIYSLQEGEVVENTSPKSYIGRAHNRTVMVLFEKDGVQDLWFLTLDVLIIAL